MNLCKQVHQRSMLVRKVLLTLLCLLALEFQASAQVSSLRSDFLKELLSESQVLTEQYERALAKLELELAAAADYEEASRVQQRREELKSLYATEGTSSSLGISLLPVNARLSGSAEARGDMLTGWRTIGSMAEWTGVRVETGGYFLELEACLTELPAMSGTAIAGRSQSKDKASFSFYEVSLLPGAQENRRSFDISLSAEEGAFTPLRIGPLNFTRSPVTLRLSPASGYPGNRVELRKLRLVKVDDGVITAQSLSPNGDALEQARARLDADFMKVQTPVLKNYAEKLKAIAAASASLSEEVESELKRLGSFSRSDEGKAEKSPLKRMLSRSGGVAGFEDIEGARLLPEETTGGDMIAIEHEGRRMKIKLLWVRCASTDEKDEHRKAFAKHFGIEESDVAALAHTAREFTIGYLSGKPLRLLLRPSADKDGSRAALVFLPEVGLYQTVLVDQGLAAVQPPVKDALRGMMEKGLISTLLDHESSARRLKYGAWSLTGEVKL